jgi:DNA-binding response OmpR family regulator
MRRHILLVDDEPYFCFSIQLALKKQGYLVSRVVDGREAMDLITGSPRQHPLPDLILLDLDLATLSGAEIVRLASRQPAAIPVMAFSGFFDAPLYRELMMLGCLEILFKPVSERLLLEKIEEAWQRN